MNKWQLWYHIHDKVISRIMGYLVMLSVAVSVFLLADHMFTIIFLFLACAIAVGAAMVFHCAASLVGTYLYAILKKSVLGR